MREFCHGLLPGILPGSCLEVSPPCRLGMTGPLASWKVVCLNCPTVAGKVVSGIPIELPAQAA